MTERMAGAGIVGVSQALGIEYRLQDGEIQYRYPWTEWERSAHDDATMSDVLGYEMLGEPRLATLVREKFQGQEK